MKKIFRYFRFFKSFLSRRQKRLKIKLHVVLALIFSLLTQSEKKYLKKRTNNW